MLFSYSIIKIAITPETFKGVLVVNWNKLTLVRILQPIY